MLAKHLVFSKKKLFNSFYQTLSFFKKPNFIPHFLKTPLFQKAQFQKTEPNSPVMEFKAIWIVMIEKHKQQNNDWLNRLYHVREK